MWLWFLTPWPVSGHGVAACIERLIQAAPYLVPKPPLVSVDLSEPEGPTTPNTYPAGI